MRRGGEIVGEMGCRSGAPCLCGLMIARRADGLPINHIPVVGSEKPGKAGARSDRRGRREGGPGRSAIMVLWRV